MDKKLVIVTTDMEIELAMFVDVNKLGDTMRAVSVARKKYYEEECHSELFEEVLSKVMNEYGIDFEMIEYEEM